MSSLKLIKNPTDVFALPEILIACKHLISMELRETEAIVLRIVPFKNSSLVVVCFSRKYGKFSLLARGARRDKSKFHGYFSPAAYVHIHFSYKETRDIQTVTAVSFVKPFYNIFLTLEGSAVAYALCELLYKIIRGNEPLPDIFDSAVVFLTMLDSGSIPAEPLFAKFLVKLSTALGFQLRLETCPRCGKKLKRGIYDRISGMILCHSCSTTRMNSIPLSENMISFINNSQKNFSENMPIQCSTAEIKSLRKILLEHLKYHTDQYIYLKSLEILDNIGL